MRLVPRNSQRKQSATRNVNPVPEKRPVARQASSRQNSSHRSSPRHGGSGEAVPPARHDSFVRESPILKTSASSTRKETYQKMPPAEGIDMRFHGKTKPQPQRRQSVVQEAFKSNGNTKPGRSHSHKYSSPGSSKVKQSKSGSPNQRYDQRQGNNSRGAKRGELGAHSSVPFGGKSHSRHHALTATRSHTSSSGAAASTSPLPSHTGLSTAAQISSGEAVFSSLDRWRKETPSIATSHGSTTHGRHGMRTQPSTGHTSLTGLSVSRACTANSSSKRPTAASARYVVKNHYDAGLSARYASAERREQTGAEHSAIRVVLPKPLHGRYVFLSVVPLPVDVTQFHSSH